MPGGLGDLGGLPPRITGVRRGWLGFGRAEPGRREPRHAAHQAPRDRPTDRAATRVPRPPRRPTRRRSGSRDAIEEVKERVRFCRECGNLTEEDLLPSARTRAATARSSASSSSRSTSSRSSARTSTAACTTCSAARCRRSTASSPRDLRIDGLLGRVERTASTEVVLATNPTMTGEATAALPCGSPARRVPRHAARERPSGRRRPRVRGRGDARAGPRGPPRDVAPQTFLRIAAFRPSRGLFAGNGRNMLHPLNRRAFGSAGSSVFLALFSSLP